MNGLHFPSEIHEKEGKSNKIPYARRLGHSSKHFQVILKAHLLMVGGNGGSESSNGLPKVLASTGLSRNVESHC